MRHLFSPCKTVLFMMTVAFFTFAAQSATAPQASTKFPCTTLSQLSWMLGTWQSKPEGNTQEIWQRLDEHTYTGMGISRDKNGNDRVSESLRLLEMRGQVFYLAKVAHNRLPVPFLATHCSGQDVRFENPDHDFPNSLRYSLVNNTLVVEVKGNHDQGFTLHFAAITSH